MNNCRASWPPPEEIFDTGRFTNNYYVNPAPFLPIAQFILPMVRPSSSGPPMSPSALNKAYSLWMSPAPSSYSSIPPSPTYDVREEIDWSDPRIQSWNGVEREQNGEFLDKCIAVWKGIGALEGIAQLSSQLKDGADPQGLVVNLNKGKPQVQPKPMSEIKKQMEEDVEKMKAELIGAKPSWLTEWEEKNRDKP